MKALFVLVIVVPYVLPEGVDTELSVSLTCSLSEEWRNIPSRARYGPVEVYCLCRKDGQTCDVSLESQSWVQSPYVGLGLPPVNQSSVAGDLDDPSHVKDEVQSHVAEAVDDHKWWFHLSRTNNRTADFAFDHTVDAVSTTLGKMSRKKFVVRVDE